MLRPPTPEDTPALLALAVSTGLFQPAEADGLLGEILRAFHAGDLTADHAVWVWADDALASPVGWAYFARDAHADGVWNLWWIGVTPARHGEGIGRELLAFVEAQARGAGGRILVIETSASPPLARTRRFYEQRGYTACGTVPDFYADGEGKVIFAKRVAGG